MAEQETSILQEAQNLVHGDRGADYGHPLDDFTVAMEILNALGFRRIEKPGGTTTRKLTPTDQPIIMQAVKLSREYNRPKRDNRTDGAGYWETLQMCHDEEQRRIHDNLASTV